MGMTLFRYAPHEVGVNTLYLTDAQTIEGFKSAMWIERYRKAGEFTIVAPVSSGLRTKLPLGALISHTETQELMMVESHEIQDTIDGDVYITITGRSFETFMEHRVLSYNGMSGLEGSQGQPTDALKTYVFAGSGTGAEHALELMEWHLYDGEEQTSMLITNCRTVNTVSGAVGTSTTREIDIADLYSVVLDLLAIDDLGIRSVRPGVNSGLPLETDIGFILHQGEDKTASVAFDHASGDIRNGQYLWTLKNKKTAVMAQGEQHRNFTTGTVATGYDARAGFLATDVDTLVLNDDLDSLTAAAESYLAQHKSTNIVRVEVTPTTNRLRYRTDYNVGDLVAVTGNYDTKGAMRVVEHVEIIDETGQSSYPTLESDAEE